jgi:hypothetical protein
MVRAFFVWAEVDVRNVGAADAILDSRKIGKAAAEQSSYSNFYGSSRTPPKDSAE